MVRGSSSLVFFFLPLNMKKIDITNSLNRTEKNLALFHTIISSRWDLLPYNNLISQYSKYNHVTYTLFLETFYYFL